MINSYGARPRQPRSVMRGTFAKIRLKNHLAPRHRGGQGPPINPAGENETDDADRP